MWFKQFKLNPYLNTPPSSVLLPIRQQCPTWGTPSLLIPHIMGKPSEPTESSCSFLWVQKHPLHAVLTSSSSGFCWKHPRRKQAAVPRALCLLFWKRAVVLGALISFLKPQHCTVVSTCSLLPCVHFLPGFKIVAGAFAMIQEWNLNDKKPSYINTSWFLIS